MAYRALKSIIMKTFYELHIQLEGGYGYTVFIEASQELTDDEVIELAASTDKFEEKADKFLVDWIDTLTEDEYLTLTA